MITPKRFVGLGPTRFCFDLIDMLDPVDMVDQRQARPMKIKIIQHVHSPIDTPGNLWSQHSGELHYAEELFGSDNVYNLTCLPMFTTSHTMHTDTIQYHYINSLPHRQRVKNTLHIKPQYLPKFQLIQTWNSWENRSNKWTIWSGHQSCCFRRPWWNLWPWPMSWQPRAPRINASFDTNLR